MTEEITLVLEKSYAEKIRMMEAVHRQKWTRFDPSILPGGGHSGESGELILNRVLNSVYTTILAILMKFYRVI